MRRLLFIRIVDGITNYSQESIPNHFIYFNCMEKSSFSALQKSSSAMRLFAYGITSEVFDEYLPMAESISNEAFDNFCRCILDLY